MDAHAIDVDEGMPVGQLLQYGFFICQSVIPQVAVAIVVIPFGSGGVTAPIAHGHYDESQLSEAVDPVHATGKGLIYRFGLRAGIYVGDDRIFFRGIEIEGLVDDAVEVCYPVICLGGECFGETVACLEEAAHICFFEVHELAACRGIEEGRHRCAIHPGLGVDKESVTVVKGYSMVCIARIEESKVRAIEPDTI